MDTTAPEMYFKLNKRVKLSNDLHVGDRIEVLGYFVEIVHIEPNAYGNFIVNTQFVDLPESFAQDNMIVILPPYMPVPLVTK